MHAFKVVSLQVLRKLLTAALKHFKVLKNIYYTFHIIVYYYYSYYTLVAHSIDDEATMTIDYDQATFCLTGYDK